MDKFVGGLGGILFIVIILFLIVLLILWIILPFAVFGTKDKLNMLIEETKTTNDRIQKIVEEIKDFRKFVTKDMPKL